MWVDSVDKITYSKDYPIIKTYDNGVKIAFRKSDGLYIRVDYYTLRSAGDIYFVLDSAGDVVLKNEDNEPSLTFYQTHGLCMVEALRAGVGVIRIMLDKNGRKVKLPVDGEVSYHQKQDCFVLWGNKLAYVFDGMLNFKKIEARRGDSVFSVNYSYRNLDEGYLAFRNVEIEYENRVRKKFFKTTNYTVEVANDWIECYQYNRNTHDVEFVKEVFQEKRVVGYM